PTAQRQPQWCRGKDRIPAPGRGWRAGGLPVANVRPGWRRAAPRKTSESAGRTGADGGGAGAGWWPSWARPKWYSKNQLNGPFLRTNLGVILMMRSQKIMSEKNGSSSLRLKTGLAEMLKGGVIMDVTNAEQATIAERAGAVAVMALERVPAQIRAEGGVARMASPKKIREIMEAVDVPVMAKCRIGHFAEAQILQALGVDYIDESEVLTPADEAHHVDKHAFTVPFVCGARDLGEALRRVAEGAAMIRTKGEAGTGDVVHAVKHLRQIIRDMKQLTVLSEEELYAQAKELKAPYELVRMVANDGKLPVPNFSAGGIATPADAALVRQLGAEAVFVGSGIFMGKRTACVQCEDGKHCYDDTC